MSVPFVTTLRSGKSNVVISPPSAETITIRVEMAEVWDVVRISVLPTESVLTVKQAALEAMYPDADALLHSDFVMKLRGWEILDENASLTDVGAINGSILLLTFRRRRAVR